MSLRSTYLELMGAWNERRLLLGQLAVTNPAVGDACFDHAAAYSITEMQTWAEAYCTDFVVSHDAGSPPTERADGYYDLAATISMYTTSTLRSTAGLNASGFKKTATPTYGIAGAGDIVLIEHFNELRKVFNVMKWTKTVGFQASHSETNEEIRGGSASGTWHGAYLSAAALWTGAGTTSTGGGAAWAACYGNYDGTNYLCALDRLYGYPEFTGIPTTLSHEIDIYQLAGLWNLDEATGTFFNHGDDAAFNVYSLIETLGTATTSTRSGMKVGTLATPPAEGPAPTNTGGDNHAYGWANRVTGGDYEQPQGVLRWDTVYS